MIENSIWFWTTFNAAALTIMFSYMAWLGSERFAHRWVWFSILLIPTFALSFGISFLAIAIAEPVGL